MKDALETCAPQPDVVGPQLVHADDRAVQDGDESLEVRRQPVTSRIFAGGVRREDVAVPLRDDPLKDASDVLEICLVGGTHRDHRLLSSTLTYTPPIPNIQLSLPTVKRLR